MEARRRLSPTVALVLIAVGVATTLVVSLGERGTLATVGRVVSIVALAALLVAAYVESRN